MNSSFKYFLKEIENCNNIITITKENYIFNW